MDYKILILKCFIYFEKIKFILYEIIIIEHQPLSLYIIYINAILSKIIVIIKEKIHGESF